VSCQFAFHYCFESLKQAECMLKNISENLHVGGYFIGTIPDANDIMKRQQIANSDLFGNDVYKIKFLSDPNNLPIFGAKYHFMLDGVVDCPEYLVYFPVLEELASKFQLRLVEKMRFDEYCAKSLRNGKFLMQRMSAVEQYDINNERQQTEDYQHAKDHLLSIGEEACGTIGKSQWDAICEFLFFDSIAHTNH